VTGHVPHPHRRDFCCAAAWSHGLGARFCQAYTRFTRTRQYPPPRLPLTKVSSTRRSRTKSTDPRLPPRSQHRGHASPLRLVRPGSAPSRATERDTKRLGRLPGTALAVMGGPGESRGLFSFCIFLKCCIGANFDSQKLYDLASLLVWDAAYASKSPTDFLDGHESASRIGSQMSLDFCVRPKTLAHRTRPLATPVVRNQLRVKFAASFNADHADNAKFYLEAAISKPVFSSIGLFYGVSFVRHCRELKPIKRQLAKPPFTGPCNATLASCSRHRPQQQPIEKFAFRRSVAGLV
jgi:hypothetical protein